MTALLVAAAALIGSVTAAPDGGPEYHGLPAVVDVAPAPAQDMVEWYGEEVPWSYTLGWFGPVVWCESRGKWHDHRDGLFQIIPSTWRAYGGTEFAPYAGDADPVDQLLVAGRVLDGQGPRAWTCARRLKIDGG